LIYTAAHLMDAVEDQEAVEELGPEATPARAVNLATGLYALSNQILSRLPGSQVDSDLLLQIIHDFHQTILVMSAGQHQGLQNTGLSLDDWWRMAERKSGSFFALGCRTGARVAGTDLRRVDGYSQYGRHLGVLLQVADDAKDFWGATPSGTFDPPKIEVCLPVLYAISVMSAEEGAMLSADIRQASESPSETAAVRTQVEQAGASLYLATKIEQHYREAVGGLGEPLGTPEARRRLLELLEWTRFAGAG
jgi:geranylgeranyl pyrophosphate synthase